MIRWMASMLLVFCVLGAHAAIEVRKFDSELQEQRYRGLIEELRCPKCQNTNLAGSDAGLAGDLKDRVYEQLQEGRSDQEIRDYMINRYGDFITYKPPVKGTTWVLWFGPFILLGMVAVLLWWRAMQQRPTSKPLSPEEAKRLQVLLKNPSEPS